MLQTVSVAQPGVHACVCTRRCRSATVQAMDTLIYELSTGQRGHLAVRRGDTVLVHRGRLVAQPRAAWWGDSLVLPVATWHEAQAFQADSVQVWACVAQAPTTLVVHRAAGPRRRLGAWLRQRWNRVLAAVRFSRSADDQPLRRVHAFGGHHRQ